MPHFFSFFLFLLFLFLVVVVPPFGRRKEGTPGLAEAETNEKKTTISEIEIQLRDSWNARCGRFTSSLNKTGSVKLCSIGSIS